MSIKKGDKVTLEYEGTLDDGTVFDATKHGDHSHPLEFVVGEGKILPAFEENVMGMNKGDKKEFKLAPEKAYGQVNPQAVQEIPKTAFGASQEPKAGMTIGLKAPTGQQFPAKIKEVKEQTVVLDLNHPLAGKTLTFNITVVDVQEASQEKKE